MMVREEFIGLCDNVVMPVPINRMSGETVERKFILPVEEMLGFRVVIIRQRERQLSKDLIKDSNHSWLEHPIYDVDTELFEFA